MIKKDFLNYLLSKGISKKTLKFYKSDISHFESWLILKLRSYGNFATSLDDSLPFINLTTAREYQAYLVKNNIPISTANRRLSALRNFSYFLFEKNYLNFDFAKDLENIKLEKKEDEEKLLELFESKLRSEKNSPNTIKNYIADVRKFLIWFKSVQKANAKE